MDLAKLTQEIQYILAPALMISSSALLLLGFQTKFSNLASRFRVLNLEVRQLAAIPVRSKEEDTRFTNLATQIQYLFSRASLVKNAVLCLYGGILCFAGTSILILINVYSSLRLYPVIVALFTLGLLSFFFSVIIAFRETRLLYRVLQVEYGPHEKP
ncbi:MAG TPA: DUF2721 domain-containing protein [Verrucomicrobiae bacterium]|jgi:hypothetical protein|nr:DUF2721 domain-containing protein [Verrucomicrobiae bacterium]